MSDSENTTHNQEQKQDSTDQQGNSGFEVLSNENSTGTDRKDELEGDQQNVVKNENQAEQQDAPNENNQDGGAQEGAGGEEQAKEEPANNEDSKNQNQEQAHGQSEHPAEGHETHHEGGSQHQPLSPTDQQAEISSPKEHNDQKEVASPKKVSAGQTPTSAGTHHEQQKAKEPKREIFVPNYTVDQPEEEEKKGHSHQKTTQPVSHQPATQNVQATGFQPQYFNPQQFAQQGAFGQQGAFVQQAAFGQPAFGQQGAFGQPGGFGQPGMFGLGPMATQPMFLPIVDVCAEYQKGNFLPGLHCLYYNLVPKDYIDNTGYNILHHAISYNNLDMVIVLLDHLKFDVHLRSKTNQSCVMIAANFGFNEMVKILLDRGGKLDEQDDTKFNALLYCIKQGHPSTFMYLITRGANYNMTDTNGCTVVHWAAYTNNVFLLRFFRRIGLEMNEVDLAGFTPLQRAISSDAVHAVRYLVEDLKVPVTGIQIDTLTNRAIKKIILDQIPNAPKDFWDAKTKLFWDLFDKAPQMYTFGVYLFNLMIGFLCYSATVVAENELNYVYHIIFFVFALYFIAYSYWYFMKSNDQIIKLKTFAYQKLGVHNSTIIDDGREMTNVRSPYKHDYLDNLISKGNVVYVDRKDDANYPYPSFLHELYFNFERNEWEKVALFDESRYCPTTLMPKKPKSRFCKETNTIVEGFNHYSHVLKRPVDKFIHPFYLLLLVQQTSLLFLFVFANVLTYWNAREASILMLIPETIYLQVTKNGAFYGLYLFVTFIYLGYSSFFTLIELYCLMRNLTYHEFFNSHKYSYLYRPNPFAQSKGQQFVKIFYNPYDKGTWNNIVDYFSRLWK
mmetsp:Transcript_32176/g.37104  ORF Transcript_32176/g.37104 Transcript_32176/m.37104 type:complete len:840 (+) Transcript_32176:84-2603(+)|eukprot:CAMPEP_0176435820 /NCGR_PEP_ID=MMETSP0127-20121128/17570_1 /TAXON_ID=938130 /ORGANISM="Platyophrya macrostoma, Strain WH" /LENGTH=839 /DNA_ID=CAMNT_0017818961 /DNA_START=80 /DNA_END=2599 /DNA_ORIENTATION=+